MKTIEFNNNGISPHRKIVAHNLLVESSPMTNSKIGSLPSSISAILALLEGLWLPMSAVFTPGVSRASVS